MRLDLTRPLVATLWQRQRLPGLALPRPPADRARRADPKPGRRLAARQTRLDGRHNTFPKIKR